MVFWLRAPSNPRRFANLCALRPVAGTDLAAERFGRSLSAIAFDTALLMRPGFDPEKQFFRNLNPAMEAFAFQHRCKFAFGKQSPFLIEDIGRRWQRENGVVKT